MKKPPLLQMTLVLALGAGFAAYLFLKASGASRGDRPSLPLKVVLFGPLPPSHDLGVVPAGARREVSFVLVNQGAAAVTLGEVATSCACLGVSLESQVVSAGESIGGTAVLDLAKEPDFRGRLMLTAEAQAAGDPRKAFAIRLSVDVR